MRPKRVNYFKSAVLLIHAVLWALLFAIAGENERRRGLVKAGVEVEDRIRALYAGVTKIFPRALGMVFRRRGKDEEVPPDSVRTVE